MSQARIKKRFLGFVLLIIPFLIGLCLFARFKGNAPAIRYADMSEVNQLGLRLYLDNPNFAKKIEARESVFISEKTNPEFYHQGGFSGIFQRLGTIQYVGFFRRGGDWYTLCVTKNEFALLLPDGSLVSNSQD